MAVYGFVRKLWLLLQEKEEFLEWSEDGRSFLLKNSAKFANEVLPNYFKHRNLASFVRQLNMYGFKKVTTDFHQGSMLSSNDEMVFENPYFISDHPELLPFIKRQESPLKRKGPADSVNAQLLNKVYSELKEMKSLQKSANTEMEELRRRNQLLWKDLTVQREASIRQGRILNQVVRFIVQLYKLPNKRKVGGQLMLGGTAEKQPRLTGLQNSENYLDSIIHSTNSPSAQSSSSVDYQGPVIKEVTYRAPTPKPPTAIFDHDYSNGLTESVEEPESEVDFFTNSENVSWPPAENVSLPSTVDTAAQNTPSSVGTASENVNQPSTSADVLDIPLALDGDFLMQSNDELYKYPADATAGNVQPLPESGSMVGTVSTIPIKDKLNDHIASVDSGLSSVKETLNANTDYLNLDRDILMELFSTENPVAYGNPTSYGKPSNATGTNFGDASSKEGPGKELVQYSGSQDAILDFGDLPDSLLDLIENDGFPLDMDALQNAELNTPPVSQQQQQQQQPLAQVATQQPSTSVPQPALEKSSKKNK